MSWLEGTLLRLASASDAAALSACLENSLVSILEQLASETSRTKVMEILVHVNKRVKADIDIQLPVQKLVKLYSESSSSFVVNFAFVYIKLGFDRLARAQQEELVPQLIAVLNTKPAAQVDVLLHLILTALPDKKGKNSVEEDDKNEVDVRKKQNDDVFVAFLKDVLLLPYGVAAPSTLDSTTEAAGLSLSRWRRASGPSWKTSADLERLKVRIIGFLEDYCDSQKVAMHLLIASADTRHSVCTQADSVLRRLANRIDWEEATIVDELYSLFLGSSDVFKADTRLRLKILGKLSVSHKAASVFPGNVQVVFDLFFGKSANSRLKAMGMGFVHHVIECCDEKQVETVGHMVLQALGKLVRDSNEETKLRASCYLALGKLGRRVPKLVNGDVLLLETLFEAMAKEDKDTQLSVQEAMSTMADAFNQMSEDKAAMLNQLLVRHIGNLHEPHVRRMAVHYASEAFSPKHLSSRFILIQGCGDDRQEIATDAHRALYKTTEWPEFKEMLKFVVDKVKEKGDRNTDTHSDEEKLPFAPGVCKQLCRYMRRCLLNSATKEKAMEVDEGDRDEVSIRNDKSYEDKSNDEPWNKAVQIRHYLEQLESFESLRTWALFTLNFFLKSQDLEAGHCLLQLTGCSTVVTRSLLKNDALPKLRGVLESPKEEMRQYAAQVYGILVATHIDAISTTQEECDKAFDRQVNSDLRTQDLKEKGVNVERLNGFITALSHILSQVQNVSNELWQQVVRDRLIRPLNQHSIMHNLTLEAIMMGLGEVGRCRQIVLSKEEGDDCNSKMIITTLFEVIQDSKIGGRTREKAALSVGRLCVGGSLNIEQRRGVLEHILNVVKEIRDVELQLTLGEALALAAVGPRSAEKRDKWRHGESSTISEEETTEDEDKLFAWLIDTLCGHISTTHPVARQCSVLWLLTLVKQGYKLSSLRLRLDQMQRGFMSVLGDNSDLVQDAACKGLSLVYEGCSDESKKEELINELVKTLTEGAKATRKVERDTKIFSEGQLGKTPGGGNITTYKELCSLASELNQPDLVYKFMHLANHNSAWNSRRGAAFGFSAIAAKAGEQLTQKLTHIVPKLYRYQFDPQPRVQQAMASIWSALISEPNATIVSNADAIISEISSNLTHSQWRVREACCGALADLLRHHVNDDDHVMAIMHLFKDVFRLMDDVKESVRVAAGKTAQSMANFGVRVCEQAGKEELVGAVLTPLIENGVGNNVNEVRQLAVATLIKITKNVAAGSEGSRSLLRKHVHILVPALLTAVGESESETQINYLSVRLNNEPEVQEKLDLMRIASAKTSAAMECTLALLPLITGEELKALVPGLVDLIKGNVGIVTKGAVSHFVTVLSQRLASELQPLAGKLLAAFVAGLTGRIVAVRKTYASVIGHLMKASKDSSMTKLCSKLRSWYLEDEQTTSSEAIALTLGAINSANPERMRTHAQLVLPIVFLAMHENTKDNNWTELWTEVVSTSTTAIRTHLESILELIKDALHSTRWRLKAQGAKAISTIVTTLKETTPETETLALYELLLKALGGRTWDGKEEVMRAFAQVCTCTNIKVLLKHDDLSTLKEALMRECKKSNIDYKLVAVKCTAEIDERLELDLFKSLFELVFPVIKEDEENGNKDEMDHELRLRLESNVYSCLAKSFRPEKLLNEMELKLSLFGALQERSKATTKRNQLEMASALKVMLTKWEELLSESDEIILPICRTLSHLLGMPKSKQLRLTALGSVSILLERWKEEMVLDELGKSVGDVVRDVSGDPESKAVAREIRTKLNEIEKKREKEQAENDQEMDQQPEESENHGVI